MHKIIFITFLMTFSAFAGGTTTLPPVALTDKVVDVERFLGKWYSIKSLPQFFTRKCRYQTAEYGLINETKISVLNKCYRRRRVTKIRGQASVVNTDTNAELVVTFNNFFTRLFRVRGDYNIIELDDNYEYVMVGSNNRESLWIMSRTKGMPEAVMEEYLQIAEDLGFDTTNLDDARF